MLNIDKYAYISRLANVSPVEKFLFAAVTMIISLWTDSLIVAVTIMLLMAGVVVYKGGIPLFFYLKLMLVPFSFLMIGVITIAINVVQDTGSLLWGVKVSGVTLGFSTRSLETSARLFFKTLGSVSCLYFLSLTTPMVEVISVLKKFKLPALFLELMDLIYRFIFVLMETADRIFTAQSSRLGYSDVRTGYQSLAQLVSTLFIRSYQRSQDLYTALEARCYNGELKVLEEKYFISRKNIVLITAADCLLIAASILTGGRI